MTEGAATRTSLLALASLFAGLCAVAMVLAALAGTWVVDYSEIFFLPTLESYKAGLLGARIVAICAALPAFLALILWGAAGAAVRESEGKLRGMALYRTGFVLALASASGAYFLQAKAGEEWSGKRRTARSDRSLSWEDRQELESRFRTMVTQRLEGDAKGFASHFEQAATARVERWAANTPLRVPNRETVRSYTVEDAGRYAKSTYEFLNIPLESYRKDDVVVLEPIKAQRLYFVFRKIGNDWKAVGPIPD